jgi:hypothetical protein
VESGKFGGMAYGTSHADLLHASQVIDGGADHAFERVGSEDVRNRPKAQAVRAARSLHIHHGVGSIFLAKGHIGPS